MTKDLIRSDYVKNRIKTAAIPLIAVGAISTLSGCGEGGSNNPERFGEPSDYSSVTLEDGATVRSDPAVINTRDGRSSNILTTLEGTTEASGPVYTFRNEDGKWYGVPQQEVGVDNDNDGIVWVNEQRAEPKE